MSPKIDNNSAIPPPLPDAKSLIQTGSTDITAILQMLMLGNSANLSAKTVIMMIVFIIIKDSVVKFVNYITTHATDTFMNIGNYFSGPVIREKFIIKGLSIDTPVFEPTTLNMNQTDNIRMLYHISNNLYNSNIESKFVNILCRRTVLDPITLPMCYDCEKGCIGKNIKFNISNENGNIVINISYQNMSRDDIKAFVETATAQYRDIIYFKHQDNLKVITINDCSPNIQKTDTILHDANDPFKMCFETFDTLEHANKEAIINQVRAASDPAMFKKEGRGKFSAVFYGPPGCGKTSTITAIAMMTGRHIVEFSFNKIKKVEQLRNILNLTFNTNLKKQDVVFVIDEIYMGKLKSRKLRKDSNDSNGSDHDRSVHNDPALLAQMQHNATMQQMQQQTNMMMGALTAVVAASATKSESKEGEKGGAGIDIGSLMKSQEPPKPVEDTLTLEDVLTCMDGLGNSNGVIIIATTNYKDELDEALVRDRRFTPFKFDYASRADIRGILERYFDRELTAEQIASLPDVEDEICHAKIRTLSTSYYDKFDECLRRIAALRKPIIV